MTDLPAKKSTEPAFFSYESLRSLGKLVVIVFMIRWSIIAPYKVPSTSMLPTIKVSDFLLAWKFAYDLKLPFTDISLINFGSPERGDIVVFRSPESPYIDFVKRVVAIGGDRIRIKDRQIYLNGEKQPLRLSRDRSVLDDVIEPKEEKLLYRENLDGKDHWAVFFNYPFYIPGLDSFPGDGEKDFVVPEGSLFFVGDNRHRSSDSRDWGVVPLNYVRGKALFVLWSFPRRDQRDDLPFVRWKRFGHWLR